MAGTRIITVDGQPILEVDYTGAKEAEMIGVLEQAEELLRNESKPLPILTLFGGTNYATPEFLRKLENDLSDLHQKITKQSVVGLSATQKMLLLGLNIFLQRNFKIHDTREEGIRYLLDDQPEEPLPSWFSKKK
ncbi:hypothetical protein QQ054_23030 [Oscillatoria amoena NRMC-F 0135]|nr:hypothetical protein [Oscillatoria amoena NRMC-F 0135]